MPSRQAERVAARYRDRVTRIRAVVDARLAELYGDLVDPAAIDASFRAFTAEAEPIIAAGQASVATLAAAAVQSIGIVDGDMLLEPDTDDAIPGTTHEGKSLPDGMAAIGPMILAAIAGGRALDEAIEFGRSLVSRFADNEVNLAGDRELEHQGSALGPLVGWEGIVSADACDPCVENAGQHPIDWTPYRHGNCQCTVIPVFAAAPG